MVSLHSFVKAFNPTISKPETIVESLAFVSKVNTSTFNVLGSKYAHYTFNMSNDTIQNTCCKWKVATTNEIEEYTTYLSSLPIVGDISTIHSIPIPIQHSIFSYLKDFCQNIYYDDLCSDGKECFYIAKFFIEETLKNCEIQSDFIYISQTQCILCLRKCPVDIEYDFMPLDKVMLEKINILQPK